MNKMLLVTVILLTCLINIMNFQIGYRSMMKGSQSISDLTNAMEDPNNSRISEHSGTVSAQGKNLRILLIATLSY